LANHDGTTLMAPKAMTARMITVMAKLSFAPPRCPFRVRFACKIENPPECYFDSLMLTVWRGRERLG
jgi:hypothetical protein